MGKPVIIDKSLEEEKNEKFKINQFNLMASEMISLNRSLPDVRMQRFVVVGRFRCLMNHFLAVEQNNIRLYYLPPQLLSFFIMKPGPHYSELSIVSSTGRQDILSQRLF